MRRSNPSQPVETASASCFVVSRLGWPPGFLKLRVCNPTSGPWPPTKGDDQPTGSSATSATTRGLFRGVGRTVPPVAVKICVVVCQWKIGENRFTIRCNLLLDEQTFTSVDESLRTGYLAPISHRLCKRYYQGTERFFSVADNQRASARTFTTGSIERPAAIALSSLLGIPEVQDWIHQ